MPDFPSEAASEELETSPDRKETPDRATGETVAIVIPEMPKELLGFSIPMSGKTARLEGLAVFLVWLKNRLDGRPLFSAEIVTPCTKPENIRFFFPDFAYDDDYRKLGADGKAINATEDVSHVPERNRIDAIAEIDIARSRQVCMGCEIRVQCLTRAILMPLNTKENETYFEGIWGGWSFGARGTIKNQFDSLRRMYNNGRRAMDAGETVDDKNAMSEDLVNKMEARALALGTP